MTYVGASISYTGYRYRSPLSYFHFCRCWHNRRRYDYGTLRRIGRKNEKRQKHYRYQPYVRCYRFACICHDWHRILVYWYNFVNMFQKVVASFLLIISACFVGTVFASPATSSINTYLPGNLNVPFQNDIQQQNGTTTGGIYSIIQKVIVAAIKYLGPIAVITISYGGILFVISYGDETKVKKAKTIIAYSLIAIVVAASGYTLIDIVNNITL